MSSSGGLSDGAWRDARLGTISKTLQDRVEKAVRTELAARDSLNRRLAGTVTLAAALLALAVALVRDASSAEVDGCIGLALQLGFVAVLGLLLSAFVIAIRASLPSARHNDNPDLFRHYALEGTPENEIASDGFKLAVAQLDDLSQGNTDRADALLQAQRAIGLALLVAAAGACTVVFVVL